MLPVLFACFIVYIYASGTTDKTTYVQGGEDPRKFSVGNKILLISLDKILKLGFIS